jgi:hypothetical protein
MARGKDTRNDPARGVSRHKFAGGGYIDVMRSPDLQREIDEKNRKEMYEEPDQANPYGMERPGTDD